MVVIVDSDNIDLYEANGTQDVRTRRHNEKDIVRINATLIQPLNMHVNVDEGKIEIYIIDAHDWVERIGKTANEICNGNNMK